MREILSLLAFTVCIFFLIALPVALLDNDGGYAAAVNARASVQMQRQMELTERARIRSETINNFTELSSIVIVSLFVLVGGGFGVWKFLDKQSERNYNREMQLLNILTGLNNNLLTGTQPHQQINISNTYLNGAPTPTNSNTLNKLLSSNKFDVNETEEGYYRVVNRETNEVKLLEVHE